RCLFIQQAQVSSSWIDLKRAHGATRFSKVLANLVHRIQVTFALIDREERRIYRHGRAEARQRTRGGIHSVNVNAFALSRGVRADIKRQLTILTGPCVGAKGERAKQTNAASLHKLAA